MVDLTAILYKGDSSMNFCDFLYAFLHNRPLLKWGFPYRKEYTLLGSKIFSQKGDKIFAGLPSLKVTRSSYM